MRIVQLISRNLPKEISTIFLKESIDSEMIEGVRKVSSAASAPSMRANIMGFQPVYHFQIQASGIMNKYDIRRSINTSEHSSFLFLACGLSFSNSDLDIAVKAFFI